MDSTSPTKPGITVLTLVPNSGDRLARCLESVHWTDHQFCVVDPRTNDGSAEVAQRLADRVVTHEYRNAADQRNWAIPRSTPNGPSCSTRTSGSPPPSRIAS
jgi:hypothetical protein